MGKYAKEIYFNYRTKENLNAYIEMLQDKELAPATINKYANDIKRFIRYAEEAGLEQIDKDNFIGL